MAKHLRKPGSAKTAAAARKGKAAAAQRELERLLAGKLRLAAERHGARQVARAIATAAARGRPAARAEASAGDLLGRTFDDPAIGLDGPGMAAFKASLETLLPGIAGDVRAIPDDPSLSIDDVVRYVTLSAAGRRAGREAAAPAAGLTVFASGVLKRAHDTVRDRFGSHFASKCSDAALMLMGGDIAVREGARPGAAALATAAAGAPTAAAALIVELADVATRSAPEVAAPVRVERLREAAKIADREALHRRVGTPQVLRQTRMVEWRDSFYKGIAPLYAEIGRRAGASAGREGRGSRQVLDVCWLNESIRTAAQPRALAEVAPDRNIDRIDLPRRILREMRFCGPLVGAPAFRTGSGKDGAGIVVAVIDGEADAAHRALAGRVMQKRNFTREPFGFPDEHGTAVAGIIGAADERLGGIAPGVSILGYKIFATDPSLDGDDFDGGLAIQQALEDGAHIANLSWGAGPAGDGRNRLARACDRAWSFGLVVVKSAGNLGPGVQTLTAPADADGVIVVGATDRKGKSVQDYSSRGPAMARRRPHLVAPGGSDASGIQTCRPGNRFGNAGAGTSFAAPQVSGLAALLLDKNPSLLPDAVRAALLRQCTRLAGVDEDTQGAGLIRLS